MKDGILCVPDDVNTTVSDEQLTTLFIPQRMKDAQIVVMIGF